MDEKQLVTGILRGDGKALRQLYLTHEPQLKRYVISRVKSPTDAEEIVQDTFLAFLDALPLFNFQSSLWTFLVSITRHEIADYWRKKYAKKAIRAIPLLGGLYDRSLYSSLETAGDVHGAIDAVYAKLHPSHVQLLKWKYEDGLKIKEMAGKLKQSAKATESQLFRARNAFQEMYTSIYGEPEFSVVAAKDEDK